MAVSTTQSIWRSGGGDQTRQAYCGTPLMIASFYIANGAVATATNVTVSATNSAPLILPAGAVVTSVIINDPGEAGTIDLGTIAIGSGTASGASIANALAVSTTGVVSYPTSLTGTPVAALSNVTVTVDSGTPGNIGGYLTYFVVDPLTGQQNV